MNFEEVSQDIRERKAREGIYLDNFAAKRLAAIEIVEGFRIIGEARDAIESLRKTGNIFCTAWGYNVDADCLQEAINMFFPSQAKGSDKDSVEELFS